MNLVARVPMTVANVGPGFDSVGLALDLFNDVFVETGVPPSVTVEGEGVGELPEDESNLVVRAMSSVAGAVGRTLPTCSLRCVNRIPLERGLGSSAAAIVAGVLIADRLLGSPFGAEDRLSIAVRLEGHADNVAACLVGGLTVAYRDADAGNWHAETLEPSPDLSPVVLIAGERISTPTARRSLPRTVAFDDAVFNAGRAALLVHALTTRPAILREALRDRLHQNVRLALAPSSREMFERLERAGVAVCVAGAGPSLLAFVDANTDMPEAGDGWVAIRARPAPAAEVRDGARGPDAGAHRSP